MGCERLFRLLRRTMTGCGLVVGRYLISYLSICFRLRELAFNVGIDVVWAVGLMLTFFVIDGLMAGQDALDTYAL